MREPQLRTVRGRGGNGGNSPAPPRHAQTSQQPHPQASAKVRPLRQLTAVSVRGLIDEKPKGESEKAPFSAAPSPPRRRDWPMLLATALRESHWVVANVTLDGKLYSKLDALRLLTVGGRYEISHRKLREAMLLMPEDDLKAIRSHLHQLDHWEIDGLGKWHSVPPPMSKEAAAGFERLWELLKG